MEKHLILPVSIFIMYLIWIIIKRRGNKKRNHTSVRISAAKDLVLLLILILLTRLYSVQIVKNEEYKNKQKKMVIGKTFVDWGKRGIIFDVNGKGLAYNNTIYDFSIDPYRAFLKENTKANVLKALKEMIDKEYISGDYKKLKKEIEELAEAKRRYKPLGKNLTEEQRRGINKIQADNKLKVSDKLFYFDEMNERKYYKPEIFRNLVGFIGIDTSRKDRKGIYGLERKYESYLKAMEIKKENVRFTREKEYAPNGDDSYSINPNGKNIYLTIDHEIQYILNDEVKKQFEATDSEEAYALIMNPNNGKIIATAYFTKNKRSVRNPVFQDRFEPGSIFKPVTVAAALNEGLINKNSTFNIGEGTIRKYNHTIKEATRSLKGVISLEDAVKKSSNVSMVLISDRMTELKLEEYLRKFGFYDKTGVDFSSETVPRTQPSKKWDKLRKSTISFGQGIDVTPIQMAAAFSAVINGGNLYRPYLVDKITDEEGTVVRRNTPKLVRRVIEKKHSETMKYMLESTVETGTGSKARVEGYRIGGKTGTAQLAVNGRYLKNDYVTSFIGFFPLEKPEYVMLFMFNKPQSAKSGGSVAAPPFAETARRIIKRNTAMHPRKIDEMAQNMREVKNEKHFDFQLSQMPDLKGLSARDVMNIFKSRYYKVDVVGVGKVYNQEPKPGTELGDTRKIKVYLK